MKIRLASSYSLLLLLLIPLFLIWYRFLQRRGQRHVWFSSAALFPILHSRTKAMLGQVLLPTKLAALALIILALARPQLLNTYQIEQNRGLDILLTLDISGSMASVDFKPKNRLEVAKEVIANFIEKRRNDRLGLVVFAANSYTKCPLTADYDILKYFLLETQIGDLEDGTALGMALANSVNRLRTSLAKTKIIILLTDGVNNRGEIDPRDAAKMAKDFQIKVYAIGVGTRGEAPYPVLDSYGRQQYAMVNVEIDETLLQDIARETGGLYFRATDKNSLQSIFGDIDRWEKSEITSKNYYETRELFPLPLAAGILLLFLVEVLRRSYLRAIP